MILVEFAIQDGEREYFDFGYYTTFTQTDYLEGKITDREMLNEFFGLDLKDDKSRFQIFFKVPYPSLNDPLVKAKMSAFADWYDWKTGISIQQGAGRSIRSKDDWAITYILDACFRSLINKQDFFPPSFKERIKTIY